MIFHRKACNFAKEVDREEQTSQHSNSLSAKHQTVFLTSQELSQKEASNQDELFVFLQKGKEIPKILLFQENPLTNIHTHTEALTAPF